MDIDLVLSLMHDRGYTVMSYSADKTQYHLVNISNGLSTTINLSGNDWQVKLSFHHGIFTTTSDYFQIDHPRYNTLFELPLLLIKKHIEHVL